MGFVKIASTQSPLSYSTLYRSYSLHYLCSTVCQSSICQWEPTSQDLRHSIHLNPKLPHSPPISISPIISPTPILHPSNLPRKTNQSPRWVLNLNELVTRRKNLKESWIGMKIDRKEDWRKEEKKMIEAKWRIEWCETKTKPREITHRGEGFSLTEESNSLISKKVSKRGV